MNTKDKYRERDLRPYRVSSQRVDVLESEGRREDACNKQEMGAHECTEQTAGRRVFKLRRRPGVHVIRSRITGRVRLGSGS
jgi:hypothetical protein